MKKCSSKLLLHFNNSLPLIIACGASLYGIRAALSHKYPDIPQRPIAYLSRSLSSAGEFDISGHCEKIYQFICDHSFTIITDHKPFLGNLAENKSVPIMPAARIQRCAIIMSAYGYNLTFKSGKENSNADCLFRFLAENKKRQSLSKNQVLLQL